MKNESTDRRVRRTRQLLHKALISLILEQPYHTISVQDILDRADVGRSTFYAHFQDKDALFRYGFDRMMDALSQHMEAQDRDAGGSPIFPSLELFRHVQENKQLYKALIPGRGVELLLKYGQNNLSQRIERYLESQYPAEGNRSIPIPVLSYYLAGAFITLLQWWLDNRMPYPPERMDEIYRQLALPGVLRVLNQQIDVS
jgi:AcrR family transcriptional regulator